MKPFRAPNAGRSGTGSGVDASGAYAKPGDLVDDVRCFVQMHTRMGGLRIVDWLAVEALLHLRE